MGQARSQAQAARSQVAQAQAQAAQAKAAVDLAQVNMTHTDAYQHDLAYSHDTGFGGLARSSAPNLLNLFQQNGITEGQVVDLGCGSGIWARELTDAGYQVIGVDLSPAMIELAHQRVPEATFHVQSFLQFRMPPCRAVTAPLWL